MNEKEIDCTYTDEIVCPHCGYNFFDSYEIFGYTDSFEGLECDKCEKVFNVWKSVSVKYNSSKIKEK